jgi:peptidoglycan/LPS O-acetylase OafA/YrhL
MLRIFPLYYCILIFCFLLSPYFSIIHWFRDYHFYFWTYTQNYLIAEKGFFTVPLGHFWSLAIEEQFYFFWPFVVLLLNKKQLIVALFILMASGIVIRSFYPVLPFASVFTPAHMDGLLTGAFVAIMIRTDPTNRPNNAAEDKSVFSCLFFNSIILFSFDAKTMELLYHPIYKAWVYSDCIVLCGCSRVFFSQYRVSETIIPGNTAMVW